MMVEDPYLDASTDLDAIIKRLTARNTARSEATIQSDVRQLLLVGDFGLGQDDLDVKLESPLGDGRRVDVEVGSTVIEVKKDLRNSLVHENAVKQLYGYVETRRAQTGRRYVGILTDGVDWYAYYLRGEFLEEVSRFRNQGTASSNLLLWLEGVLATRVNIKPTADEIITRLGAASSSYALDRSTLAALYEDNKGLGTVKLKRQLWADLLSSALGTQFEDDDDLFIEHTLLVASAEIIAHLVVGINAAELQPATLLTGLRFETARLYGVVEQDFFDWIIEVPGGAEYTRALARRLARFNWSSVEHDVLKVLYESIIGSETRKSLGEYYTPDWLAERIVDVAVDNPLEQRVLDPACGSGTFLFFAVRRFLKSAEEAGLALREALERLSSHVLGLDLHPVAVTFARVTYLLAIGRDRLTSPARGSIHVPVYLGDSVQWYEREDLLSQGFLTIPTGPGGQLWESDLRFPEALLADGARFDRIISTLADLASKPRKGKKEPSLPSGVVQRLGLSSEELPSLEENFRLLCRLHDEGRDHIWSYYVRNRARPVWLSRKENRVDCLIGNPPWLSYRHMPVDMQKLFREMSMSRKMWQGFEVATQQDLSGIFVARAVQQYLRPGGSFSFVMPNAALDRGYFSGFREAYYPDPTAPTAVRFSTSWDLRRLRPHFFPRGAAVVFGEKSENLSAGPMPRATLRWTGTLPRNLTKWADVSKYATQELSQLAVATKSGAAGSPYRMRFANGASVFPRLFFMVDVLDDGPLGLGTGRRSVRSGRSSTEKDPWKSLPRLEGVVEQEFLRPTVLGENILPYRTLESRLSLIPIEGGAILDSSNPRLDYYEGLSEWWRQAEEVWLAHRSSNRLTLSERLNFRRGLEDQFPIAPLRVVYAKSGMHVAASIVEDPSAIIDHTLYWAAATSQEEAQYLCTILNNPALTDLVRPLMAYGKDERHIDKAVWHLSIPEFSAEDPRHARLAELGDALKGVAEAIPVATNENFAVARRRVRAALSADERSGEVTDLLVEMLG